MMPISDIKHDLPYFGKSEMWVDDDGQNVEEIIKSIKRSHDLDKTDYDKHCLDFWRGNAKDTAKLLFDFHKRYIKYVIEPESDQTVKTPGRLINDRHGDCKHYSLFTCGIVDALNRKGYPIEAKYRFVSDTPDVEVHHVFAVVTEPSQIGYPSRAKQWGADKIRDYALKSGLRLVHGYEVEGRVNAVSGTGKEYWCDPVLDNFNERPNFHNTKDYRMAINRLSGTKEHDIAIVAGRNRNPFHNKEQLLAYLHHHGARPEHFQNEREMQSFLINKLREDVARFKNMRRPDAPAIGKKNKHHKNFLKSIAHGFEVNAKNVAHGIQVDAANAKTLALKVSLAAARGPFLGLVDLNTFNLAHRLRDTLMSPQHRGALLQKWKDLGGNDKTLINSVNNGWRVYKKHHGGWNEARDRVSGRRLAGPEIAAAVALASGIIAALEKFIHSDAPKQEEAIADAATTGTKDLVHKAHKHISKQPGDSNTASDVPLGDNASNGTMSVSTGVDANGNPTLAITSVDHPVLNNAGKSVEQLRPEDPDAPDADDPDDVPGGGPVAKQHGHGGGMDIEQKIKDFAEEHKGAGIGLGVGVVGGIVVGKFSGAKKNKQGAFPVIGGIVGVIIGVMADKKRE